MKLNKIEDELRFKLEALEYNLKIRDYEITNNSKIILTSLLTFKEIKKVIKIIEKIVGEEDFYTIALKYNVDCVSADTYEILVGEKQRRKTVKQMIKLIRYYEEILEWGDKNE